MDLHQGPGQRILRDIARCISAQQTNSDTGRVGGSTSGCVRASCVDAFSAGYQVVAVEDGCFDRARTPHLANLFDLHAKYASVLTADEVIAALSRSAVAA